MRAYWRIGDGWVKDLLGLPAIVGQPRRGSQRHRQEEDVSFNNNDKNTGRFRHFLKVETNRTRWLRSEWVVNMVNSSLGVFFLEPQLMGKPKLLQGGFEFGEGRTQYQL